MPTGGRYGFMLDRVRWPTRPSTTSSCRRLPHCCVSPTPGRQLLHLLPLCARRQWQCYPAKRGRDAASCCALSHALSLLPPPAALPCPTPQEYRGGKTKLQGFFEG